MAQITLLDSEISELLLEKPKAFPKYSTQIINIVNQNAQGTRPKIVGQMSDLIQEWRTVCKGKPSYKGYEGWKRWYIETHPDAVENATNTVYDKLLQMRPVMDAITKELVKEWIQDLVITKTFSGLEVQEIILRKLALLEKKKYRLATPAEESKGIDGFIGDTPVSIKATTYKVKMSLPEHIDVKMVYYEKKKGKIIITL
jgi:hypothetical protein